MIRIVSNGGGSYVPVPELEVSSSSLLFPPAFAFLLDRSGDGSREHLDRLPTGVFSVCRLYGSGADGGSDGFLWRDE